MLEAPHSRVWGLYAIGESRIPVADRITTTSKVQHLAERKQPLWKRLGYATEWQYRVTKAREDGYSLAEHTRERRTQRARSEGFPTSGTRARYVRERRRAPLPPEQDAERRSRIVASGRQRMLDRFGVKSPYALNRIRAQNRRWSENHPTYFASDINHYDEFIDGRTDDYSEQRIGYIVAFHSAIVNKNTNWESLEENPDYYKNGPFSKKVGNAAQYFYLVKYARKMSADEYETRYGIGSVLAAEKQEYPKP